MVASMFAAGGGSGGREMDADEENSPDERPDDADIDKPSKRSRK